MRDVPHCPYSAAVAVGVEVAEVVVLDEVVEEVVDVDLAELVVGPVGGVVGACAHRKGQKL